MAHHGLAVAVTFGWTVLSLSHIFCVLDEYRLFSDRICLMPMFLRFPRVEIFMYGVLACIWLLFISRRPSRYFAGFLYVMLIVGMFAVNTLDWEPDETASYVIYTANIIMQALIHGDAAIDEQRHDRRGFPPPTRHRGGGRGRQAHVL